MEFVAIVLVVISAAIHAVRNMLTKNSGSKIAFIWLYQSVSILLFLPLFAYEFLRHDIDLLVAVGAGIFGGILHALYSICVAKTYQQNDLSLAYPIVRSSPAPILLISVLFLGESVSLFGTVGILLISLGVYCIGMNRFSFEEFIQPIKKIGSSSSINYAFITLGVVVIYSLVDKVVVSFVVPIIYLVLFHVFSNVVLTFVVRLTVPGSIVKKEWKENWKSIGINGFLGITGYALVLIAFSVERLSYVTGLMQISIVFGVLLGWLVRKEKNTAMRMACAVVIFAGSYLIAIG